MCNRSDRPKRFDLPTNPSAIRLRRGERGDFEFLWRLQSEAMRPSVERQFGPWDEKFQRELFESNTDASAHDIIEVDGTPAGCQWVRKHANALELVRIHVLPEHQGSGIGTWCIERLIERSAASGLPIRLQVFRTSRAQSLYQALGFQTVGSSETHLIMERAPA